MSQPSNTRQSELIACMVSTALSQDTLFGIVEVLKNIAASVDAYGCILWEVAPWADFKSNPPTGKMFVSASWFRDGIELSLHELPLDGSANGLAVWKQEIQNIENMATDPRMFTHRFSTEVAKLKSMCAVPIQPEENQSPKYSLSVYRKESELYFTEEETFFTKRMADLMPSLYRAIRDRVGRILLTDINNILDEVEQKAKNNEDAISEIKKGLNEVCRKVANTFQCVESTIFLENSLESENVFKLFATTWANWTKEKDSYKPQKEEGLTGWVLEKKLPVRIFNLATFEEDQEKLQKEYDDIVWKDSLRIRNSAREILALPEDSDLPPLSFMAVPIIRGDKLLGVIRCCMARKAPWFYVDRQLEVLELVAAQISRFWNDWLQHLEEKEENRSWTKLVTEISNFNHTVQKELNSSSLNETRLYKEILLLAQRAIRGADILDIRLADQTKQELYFASTLGDAWKKGAKAEGAKRLSKRFFINQPPLNNSLLGLKVLKDGEARCIMNAELAGYKSETFPETKRIVIAPIGVQKRVIGLLDVRGIGNKPFTNHVLLMAKMLGQQLGLYLSLWENEKQQRQVFEDLWHQLKSPVRQTFARAQSLVQKLVNEYWLSSDVEKADELAHELRMLRGVARKAKKVAVNAGLFKDLASEGKLKLSQYRLKRLESDEVAKLLIEVSMDTQLALEEYRKIKFWVEKEKFDGLNKHVIKVNFDLLEQAVNCLLDNAGKYSYPNTRVSVSGGEEVQEDKHYFYIAVKNLGLVIAADEVEKCKERNYRGDMAKITTGEGSGIGLWVVDHILQAHGGELLIIPTTDKGWTEVRLCFPVSK